MATPKSPITAQRLKEAMHDANITAQELADLAGLNKASVSQYRSGTHAPSNISSGKMAKVLGVNPVWLMGFDVPKERKDADMESIGSLVAIDPERAKEVLEIFMNMDDTSYKSFIDLAQKFKKGSN